MTQAAAAVIGGGEGGVPPSRRPDPTRERAPRDLRGRMERRYEHGPYEMLARLRPAAPRRRGG